jgi:hypothetical protein
MDNFRTLAFTFSGAFCRFPHPLAITAADVEEPGSANADGINGALPFLELCR